VSYLILIVAFLVLFHFVYESILAPSFRLKLRFELLCLRDELRMLKIQLGDSLGDEHFHRLRDSINALISMLYRFDVVTLATLQREIRRRPDLRDRVELRARLLDSCGVPQAQRIRQRSLVIATKAIAVNSGGWCVFLVPPALAYLGIYRLRTLVKASVSLSEWDLSRVVPPQERGPAV
jgi:hypothetical protein